MDNIEETKRILHEQVDKLTDESVFIFSSAIRENDRLIGIGETVKASLANITDIICNLIRKSLVRMSATGGLCADYAVRLGHAIDAACIDAASEVFSKMSDDQKIAEIIDLLDKTSDKQEDE